MTFIPDSISTNELLRLKANAEPDNIPQESTVNLAVYIEEVLKSLQENHPGPVAFKALALRILSNLGAWHDVMAEKKFKEGDECSLLWAGDEKLIHMAWSCLNEVDLGEDCCECNTN